MWGKKRKINSTQKNKSLTGAECNSSIYNKYNALFVAIILGKSYCLNVALNEDEDVGIVGVKFLYYCIKLFLC